MTYPTATCRNTACTVVTYAYREDGRTEVPECPGCSLLTLTSTLTDALEKASAERDQLRAEVHELEKPHQCSYSGMAVATCRQAICDCFGGSTWPQRAMEVERDARVAEAELDALRAEIGKCQRLVSEGLLTHEEAFHVIGNAASGGTRQDTRA